MNQRGSTLLLVTMIVTLLAGMAAALYLVTQNQRSGFTAVRQHMLAVSRANAGAEDALAKLRGGVSFLNTSLINGSYPSYAAAANALDGGTANAYLADPYTDASNVLQFEADVFYRSAPPGATNTGATLVIHATGYSAAQTSPSLSAAVVEIEVGSLNVPPPCYAGGGGMNGC